MRRLHFPIALCVGFAALQIALAASLARRFVYGALPWVLSWYAGWLLLEWWFR